MTRITLRTLDVAASLLAAPSSEPFRIDVPDASADEMDSRKRQDTNFKFEVVFHDDAPSSAVTFAKKTRTDTSFKFELQGTPPVPDSEPDAGSGLSTFDIHESGDGSLLPDEASAMAGKKRQDTSFSFEVTTRDDSADDATGSAEELGGRTRKDTSFKFEIVVSAPSAHEALGSPKRKSATFDFEYTAPPADSDASATTHSSITLESP